MSRKTEELEKQLAILKAQNEILNQAAEIDTQTIKRLKLDAEKGAAVRKLKKDLENALKERDAAKQAARDFEARFLETAADCRDKELQIAAAEKERGAAVEALDALKAWRNKPSRRWNYIWEAGAKNPAAGSYVLVIAFNVGDLIEKISSGDRKFGLDFVVRDAFFRNLNGYKMDYVGVPPGWMVAAWQNIVDPDWERVSVDALEGVRVWADNDAAMEKEIKKIRIQEGAARAEDVKKMFDKTREKLQKIHYKGKVDKLNRSLIFLGGRKKDD